MNKKKNTFTDFDLAVAQSTMPKINLTKMMESVMSLAKIANISEEEIQNIFKESPEEKAMREEAEELEAYFKNLEDTIEPIDPSILTNIQIKLLELRAKTFNHSTFSDKEREEIYIKIEKCQMILKYCNKELEQNPKKFLGFCIVQMQKAIDEMEEKLKISTK